ncbi:MAG: two-component sensor histidine kinase [Rhodospirillaceae bacterium TMED8]|nr:two-component sensor histidine kinase [Magnetovibrio sp.]OUT52017.1 MAG: two-component sensor histidine kinase [Rhodospirillaceae bacterium TMED8]|tara:strand:- start:1329 stop:2447 length:1119 start_codon:yes stop_codon:yes gene_type:complete
MSNGVNFSIRRPHLGNGVSSESVLNSLTAPIIAVNQNNVLTVVNPAGEQFFHASAAYLVDKPLGNVIPVDSPLFSLINQSRSHNQAMSEYDIPLETPRIGSQFVNLHAAPIPDSSGAVGVLIILRSIADKIDRQLTHRGSARSITAMASLMAHEVKNPLSGIRGAAQLIEQVMDGENKKLTQLICKEVDRICALVDRIGLFSNEVSLSREAVNIHQVLDHVHQIARNGFAKGIKIVTTFDPSLPLVSGNRDQLVQVFLNLVKNAAEAVSVEGGQINLESAYRHGIRIASPGSSNRVQLPLVISVMDNGSGISEDILPHLFDPFVSNKPKGSGLGLALVAQIVQGHGGVIEAESNPKRTVFRTLLPMYKPERG